MQNLVRRWRGLTFGIEIMCAHSTMQIHRGANGETAKEVKFDLVGPRRDKPVDHIVVLAYSSSVRSARKLGDGRPRYKRGPQASWGFRTGNVLLKSQRYL